MARVDSLIFLHLTTTLDPDCGKSRQLNLLDLTTALDPIDYGMCCWQLNLATLDRCTWPRKSIPGLLKLLQIRALYTIFYTLSYILSIFGQVMTERNHLCVWSCSKHSCLTPLKSYNVTFKKIPCMINHIMLKNLSNLPWLCTFFQREGREICCLWFFTFPEIGLDFLCTCELYYVPFRFL